MYSVKMTDVLGRAFALDARLFPEDVPYRERDAQWWVVETGDSRSRRVIGYAAARIFGTRPATCYLTRVGVAVRHRGHGLQRRLIRARERWAASRGCTEVVTYVSSDNVHSLNSLIACGYRACLPGEAGYDDMNGFLTVRKDLTC